MKVKTLSLMFVFLFVHVLLHAQINELQRSTPEEQGVPSKAVISLFDSLTALPKTDIHSVMVLRHGKVIGEIYPKPFSPEYKHTMYSCSKTFVGAAVGLAIEENLLRLTDRVALLFPEQLQDSVSNNLANITVRDLLTMQAGITPDWNMRNLCTNWIQRYLSKEVKAPGQNFQYDSICTYLLSAIVQKVTGMKLLDYLNKKLFVHMNITDVEWEISPEGVNTGGWGLYIQSESLAKFGQLFLNKGVWNGKQILPASWVEQMMSLQKETNDDNYGYQMWLCDYKGAVRADGALGQYILIMPKEDMVVVITECTMINGRNQRGFVWNELLPQIKDTPLVVGRDYKKLQKKQNEYALPLVKGKKSSNIEKQLNKRIIKLESNKYGWESVSIDFFSGKVQMNITTIDGKKDIYPFGYNKWLVGEIKSYPPYSINPVDKFKGLDKSFIVAGSYAWQENDIMKLKVHYVNWISALDISIKINSDNVILNVKENFSSDNIVINGTM